jgi:hypothetical protein
MINAGGLLKQRRVVMTTRYVPLQRMRKHPPRVKKHQPRGKKDKTEADESASESERAA